MSGLCRISSWHIRVAAETRVKMVQCRRTVGDSDSGYEDEESAQSKLICNCRLQSVLWVRVVTSEEEQAKTDQ